MTISDFESAYFHIGNSGITQGIAAAPLHEEGDELVGFEYALFVHLDSHGVSGPRVMVPLVHREQVKALISQLQSVLAADDMVEDWDEEYAGGIHVHARRGKAVDYIVETGDDLDTPVDDEYHDEDAAAAA